MANLEKVQVTPDEEARVVVNERTGTIVVGANVSISQVAISHGNLSVEVSSNPIISQPGPFSRGQTVVVPQTQTQVNVQQSKLSVVNATASVQDVAKALNALGVTPRDMIAIFQALKDAGALKARLIIM
jgi:flagellar P-ring protein precursor FlgI